MKQIRILPLKKGKQSIYIGIGLAGHYTPLYENGELPAGTYDLVPSKIKPWTP